MTEEEIQQNKALRKAILEILYAERSEFVIDTEKLKRELSEQGLSMDDKRLHGEIKYLEGEGLLETKGAFMGQAYLNFAGIGITSSGINLVENPKEFNRLFSINVSNISNKGVMAVNGGSINAGESILVGNRGNETKHIRNPHKQYWGMLFGDIVRWLLDHIVAEIIVAIIVVAILVWFGIKQ